MTQLLTLEDTAKMLCLSPKTLRNWVTLRKIPFVKIGKAVRFNARRIEEFIKRREIETHQIWR